MRFPPYIIEMLENRCGRKIEIPADCNFLALDIESKTKVHIGATTLKRLTGFQPDEREPHTSTLNSVANYLGYKNWEELTAVAAKSNSAMDFHENELRASDISIGSLLEITYLPDRKITFKHLKDNLFTVTESKNSKLMVNDKVLIHHFVLNHPLYVQNVERGGKSIGEYTAGIVSGITSIKIIDR